MSENWYGYEPRPDPQHWRSAAEWLECQALHGPLFDEVGDEPVSPWRVLDIICDAVMAGADAIEEGATKEACCYDRQRRNRAAQAQIDREQEK